LIWSASLVRSCHSSSLRIAKSVSIVKIVHFSILVSISKSAFKADRTYDIDLADLFSASHDPVSSEETGE
jgi:hypothetical protein